MTHAPESLKSIMDLAEIERLQCSCELHDGILQYLIGARMQLESLRSQLRSGIAISESQIIAIENILQRGTREGRLWIGQLRGDSFHRQSSLAEAITALIQEAQQRSETPEIIARVDLQIDHSASEPEIRLAAYRIVQESLRNALQYSQATQIQVSVTTEPGFFKVQVSDNGQGFQPENVAQDHFGLISMRTRTALTHGQFQLTTGVGQGTTIDVTWAI